MQYRHGQRLPPEAVGVPARLSVNPRARRLSIRIDGRAGEAVLVAPSERKLGEVVAFARTKSDWMRERLAERPDGAPLEPGAVVQTVADRHGVSTGQLYTWRKQMLSMAMAGFVPVEVVPEPSHALPAPPAMPAIVEAAGSLEIVLPSGASIRVTGAVDAATLRMVLAELGGR